MSTKVKLNQIIALNAPKKAEFEKFITKYYHLVQKNEPFFGLERHYTPKNEDGESLPSESSKVQIKVEDLLQALQNPWIEMLDVVLTNDIGNCEAKADIIIDDIVILSQVPVSTLIFLEKQITNWKNLLSKLPILPLSEDYIFDKNLGLHTTKTIETVRTKKVEEALVLYPATAEHPAQCKSITKDIIAGTWMTKKLSSAITNTRLEYLLDRANKLKEAIIKAREQANSIEIDQQKGGEKLLSYLFS